MLLVSSDVRAKCTHSILSLSDVFESFSFKKYSTALTSWLVVFSIVLIRLKSFSVILYRFLTFAISRVVNFFKWVFLISERAIKYSPSIITRYFIRASSEKYGASARVFSKYLPSSGLIAFFAILNFVFL